MVTYENFPRLKRACEVFESEIDSHSLEEIVEFKKNTRSEFARLILLGINGIMWETVREIIDKFPTYAVGEVKPEKPKEKVNIGKVDTRIKSGSWGALKTFKCIERYPDNKMYSHDEAESILGSCWLERVYENYDLKTHIMVWINNSNYCLRSNINKNNVVDF